MDPTDLDEDIEACRGMLGAALDAGAEDVTPLRARVEQDLAAEQGVVARLRALRTSHRIALIFGLAACVTVISVVATPRVDLGEFPGGRMAVTLGLLAAVTAAAAWRLLRPLHAPPPTVWASRLLLAAGVLLPCVIAWIPMSHVGSDPGTGAVFAAQCSKCLAFGGVMGFPVLLVAFLARRSRVDGAAVAALAGVASGLTGNLALQVHCPITDPMHLLGGHALLIALLGVAAAAWKR